MSPRGIDLVLTSGVPWLVAIGTPLVLALLLLSRPWRQTTITLMPWSALPALALSVLTPSTTSIDLPWLLLGTRLGLDQTGQVFLSFTALLWLLAGAYARRYLDHDAAAHQFGGYYLVTMAGNIGVILAQDMLSFFVFFAVMSFASYGLILHNRDAEAVRAGRIYIILVLLGEVLLFAALVLAASHSKSLFFEVMAPHMAHAPMRHWFIAFILVGFGIKVGVLPLHVWLPLAHPAAPTPASAVLSGTMIKVGLLGWLRFLPLGGVAFPAWGSLCMTAGLVAAFFGVLMGLGQRHPKTVLAYSSISQMGLLTVLVGVGLTAPASWTWILAAILAYATHHALAKGALFLGVGVAAATPAAAWKRRLVAAGLTLPALALAGAPLSSGALAKAALKKATALAPTPWPDILGTGLPWAAVGTTLLMGRFLYLLWPRPTGKATRLPAGLWVPWVVLLVGIPLMALLLPWHDVIQMTQQSLTSKILKSTVWPVCVGALLVWGMLACSRRYGVGVARWIPAGDLLMPAVWLMQRLSQVYHVYVVTPSVTWWTHRVPPWHRLSALWLQGRLLTQWEGRLRSWVVAGTLFLVLAITLLALLATVGFQMENL